jgi:hypothetical protein
VSTSYPKRDPFFAHRFTRLLFKSCAAQDIGHHACLLLIHIAHTEDAAHYSGPIRFWNGQLMDTMGFTSPKQLARARETAIERGWLHYERQHDRSVGQYWVAIPRQFLNITDSMIEPTHSEFAHENGTEAGKQGGMGEASFPLREREAEREVAKECLGNGIRNVSESGKPSIPVPVPNPSPINETKAAQAPPALVLTTEPLPAETAKPKRQRKAMGGGESVPIPIILDTEAFRLRWASWVKYRQEIGKPLVSTTATQQLNDFIKWGEARAIAAIEHTISKGWWGLREPDAPAGNGGNSQLTGQQLMAMGKVDPNRPGRTPETQLPTSAERAESRNRPPAPDDDPSKIRTRKAVIAYWRRDCRDEEAAGKPISRERPYPWHKAWAEMTPDEKAAKGDQPYGIH